MLFIDGRTLNEPVGCWVSSFSQTGPPYSCDKMSERTVGVGEKYLLRRSSASSICINMVLSTRDSGTQAAEEIGPAQSENHTGRPGGDYRT